MEKIDVKEFKGLYTNILDNSANYSIFSDMDKVKVTKKYLESEGYKLESRLEDVDKKLVKDIIEAKIVYLDDDKFWYDKTVSKYRPDFQKHLLIFTSTSLVVYLIKETGLEQLNTFEVSGYQKSISVNGLVKILTTDNIYFLYYRRINQVKTIQFANTYIGITGLTCYANSNDANSITNPEITFDIVAKETIYWMSEGVFGEGLRNSPYRMNPLWDLTSRNDGKFLAFVGTLYLLSPKHNTLNLQTKGWYDFDSTVTFVFIPIDYQNNNIYLTPTCVNSSLILNNPLTYGTLRDTLYIRDNKYTPNLTTGLSSNMVIDPNGSYFIKNGQLNYKPFFDNFILYDPNNNQPVPWGNPVFFELLPDVGKHAIKQSNFFLWLNNPELKHRIIGTYNLSATSFGFKIEENNQQIVGNFLQTITHIDGSEYIIGKGQVYATSSATKVIYGVKPIRSFPSSVTQSKLYIGFGIKPSNYELISSKALYKGEVFDELSYFGYLDLTGILLSNMLAVYGDIDQFEYIRGGEDYVLINNIGFLIKGGTVYYSPNDTSNAIFYKNRFIPNVYGDQLLNMGGMLGIITYNKEVILISTQIIENEIYFKEYDRVGFVIEGKNQTLEISDGTLMSLREGLYLSTPQDKQLLSEPINDIFENGDLPKLLYDDFNKRIMVQKKNGDSYDTYVFDLINKVWLKFKNFYLINTVFNGDYILIIKDDRFYKVELEQAEGYLQFHQSNLGSEKMVKRLVGLRIDYEGMITMVKERSSNSEALMRSTGQLTRRVEEFYFKVGDQLPMVNMGFEIKFNGKIYSMEVLYDVLGEFPKDYIGV